MISIVQKIGILLIHYKPIIRNGHRLKGKEFCEEMNRVFHDGERIFAHVGRSHVAAVVPIQDDTNAITYKIIDTWDSSNECIGDYWFKPVKPDSNDSEQTTNPSYKIQDKLYHPLYGMGTIIEIAAGIITIDFIEKGRRRLGMDWVQNHCKFRREQKESS